MTSFVLSKVQAKIQGLFGGTKDMRVTEWQCKWSEKLIDNLGIVEQG